MQRTRVSRTAAAGCLSKSVSRSVVQVRGTVSLFRRRRFHAHTDFILETWRPQKSKWPRAPLSSCSSNALPRCIGSSKARSNCYPSASTSSGSTLANGLQSGALFSHLTSDSRFHALNRITASTRSLLRLAPRVARDRNRFVDDLEIVKYLCKELWTECFKKQADKLQTNHKVSSPRDRIGSYASHSSSSSAKSSSESLA
jgi:hypothetical protein